MKVKHCALISLTIFTLIGAGRLLATIDESESFVFAALGDYGSDRNGNPGKVANLIKSWNPDFVITLGDNNYNWRDQEIDYTVGRLYSDYIYPYNGDYGSGSNTGTNRFWPILGNHDWEDGGLTDYLNYFTLPNNERYYDVRYGDVHLFALSIHKEPDGNTPRSKQAKWLKAKLQQSDAKWKIVYSHYPPYSSGVNGGRASSRWPFKEWGATIHLAGKLHFYERIEVDGFPYVVNGLGGHRRYPFPQISPDSIVQYNDNYGALRISGNDEKITFAFYNVEGEVVDQFQITNS